MRCGSPVSAKLRGSKRIPRISNTIIYSVRAGAADLGAVPAAAGNTGGEADLHRPDVPAGGVGLPLQLKCLKV